MMQQQIPQPWHVLSAFGHGLSQKAVNVRVHFDHSLGKVTHTRYQHTDSCGKYVVTMHLIGPNWHCLCTHF